jgi:homoserine dehydrogenase
MTALANHCSSLPRATLIARTTGNLSSGPSPTLHLLGAGKVGQAFLRLLASTRLVLVAATDSSATRHDAEGLSPLELLAAKAGGAFAALPGAERVPLPLVASLSRAEIVVDALPSSGDPAASVARCRAALRAGKKVVLASKDALARAADELLDFGGGGRVGINAALGGTGRALTAELPELRTRCREVALVGNASTTALVQALEEGLTLEDGIARCQALQVLEPDPTLDLDGTDAATKLAIVARALFGTALAPWEVARDDARLLDPELLRWRKQRGHTTRLVARVTREGKASVAFEDLPPGSVLRVPHDRVVYSYLLDDRATRVHVGSGVGAEATARALLQDVEGFVGGVA